MKGTYAHGCCHQGYPDQREVDKFLVQIQTRLKNRLRLHLQQAHHDFNRLYHQSNLSRPNMLLADYHLSITEMSNQLNNFLYRFQVLIITLKNTDNFV